MPVARVWSVALTGVTGRLVEIEADIGAGLPGTKLVGLPDAGVREAKDRVRSAIRNSRLPWPNTQLTLALSPANLPKVGSAYDVGIAVAVLTASGIVPQTRLPETSLIGELALDGRIRPVRGVLPSLLAARDAGMKVAVVPAESLGEASLVDGIEVWGAARLTDVVAWLRDLEPLVAPSDGPRSAVEQPPPDLVDVAGQEDARWALEVAAAGGHHLLMVGPPGVGKTMLAKRLPGLLPALSDDEALEVTAVHSVDGSLRSDTPLVRVPPLMAPHHSVSLAGLIGGGAKVPVPGAVSKAHRGVLLLDEAAEFGTQLLDSLRTALEEGEVRLARSLGVVVYPARFQLVLATNPCPCAQANDNDCSCSAQARRALPGQVVRAVAGQGRHSRADASRDRHGGLRRAPARDNCRSAKTGDHRAGASGRALGRSRLAHQRRGAGSPPAHGVRTAAQGDGWAGTGTGAGHRHGPRRGPLPAAGMDAGRHLRPRHARCGRDQHRDGLPGAGGSGVSTPHDVASGPSDGTPSARCAASERTEVATDVRLARAYLLQVAEPPAPALAALVAVYGPVEAAERVRSGRVPDAVRSETEARSQCQVSVADLERAGEEYGARLLIPEDDEWPGWPLHCLDVATSRGAAGMTVPLALWARGSGRFDAAATRAVTVVGSRAASKYGEHIAGDWSYTLVGEDCAIFSGAAYGIDGAAHRGALAANGVTVAVLGCGIGAGYPAGHDLLLRKIAERGLVVSEYWPGTPPARHRFLVRNRLLAAMSSATVVVEAGLRSGARNTASTARLLGKPVLAVPGPLTARNSKGCHAMIRAQTATLVTSVREVLEVAGSMGVDADGQEKSPERPTDSLPPDALRVHEALEPDVIKPVSRLSVEAGVPQRRVRSVLPMLEAEGLSQKEPGGWRRPREERRAGGLATSA